MLSLSRYEIDKSINIFKIFQFTVMVIELEQKFMSSQNELAYIQKHLSKRLLKMIKWFLLGVVRTFLSASYLLQAQFISKKINSIDWDTQRKNEEHGSSTEYENLYFKPCQRWSAATKCDHQKRNDGRWLVLLKETTLNIYI